MNVGEAIRAKREQDHRVADLNGTPEELARRQEVIDSATSLVGSLAAYLGAEIEPVAGSDPIEDLKFSSRLLFLLDGNMVGAEGFEPPASSV